MLPIHTGAPPSPGENPQGGFLPETFVYMQNSGALLGYRRNCGWSISSGRRRKLGARPAGPNEERKLYQPMLLAFTGPARRCFLAMPAGTRRLGEAKMCMYIERAVTESVSLLKKPACLSLRRCLSEDGSPVRKRICGKAHRKWRALSGQVRAFPLYNVLERGRQCQSSAAGGKRRMQVSAVTDADGCAKAAADAYDHRADIHLSYTADCECFRGTRETLPCEKPENDGAGIDAETALPVSVRGLFCGRGLIPFTGFFAGVSLCRFMCSSQHLGERRVPVENLGRRGRAAPMRVRRRTGKGRQLFLDFQCPCAVPLGRCLRHDGGESGMCKAAKRKRTGH